MIEKSGKVFNGKAKCRRCAEFFQCSRLHLLKNHIKKRLEQRKVDQAKNDGEERVKNIGRNESAERTGVGQNSKISFHLKNWGESACKLRKFA